MHLFVFFFHFCVFKVEAQKYTEKILLRWSQYEKIELSMDFIGLRSSADLVVM